MADSSLEFSLDVAYFVPKTPARQRRIAAMLRSLKLSRGDGRHVFSHAFGSSDAGPYVVVHIDESKYESTPTNYYVQLHLHETEGVDTTRPGVQWAFTKLTELARGEEPLMAFFDVEADFEESPAPSIAAPPLTVGGRTLAVAGVEYAAPIQVGGIDRFRWTTHEKTIKVTLSFSDNLMLKELPNLWKRAKARVEGYVREAFPR